MTVTRQSFAHSLLTTLSLPTTTENLRILVAWQTAEGGAGPQFGVAGNVAAYNPLNSTLALPGSQNTPGNVPPVQAYANWSQGLQATAQTLAQANMASIVSMLQSGTASPSMAASVIDNSNWGTKTLTASAISGASVSPNDSGQTIAGTIAGGIYGLGGSGTAGNTVNPSLWIVGSVQNPDQDYWTTMNQYAMQAQMYLFSDGETLYLADGLKLMGQTPTAVIVLYDPHVISASLTYDNCLALDTPVPTPDGWTTMDDIQRGDHVLGADGKPTRVVGVSEVHHGHDCYRLTFSDGTSVVADDGHLWETNSFTRVGECCPMGDRSFRGIRTTAQIRETLMTAGGRAQPDGKANHRIRIPEPLKLPERDLPVDPYVLGYWLGDGTTGTPIITCGTEDIESLVAEVQRAGYGHNSRTAISTGFSRRTYWRVSPQVLKPDGSSTCVTAACNRPAKARGLCMTCYSRQSRRGDLPGLRRTGFSAQLRSAGVFTEKQIPAEYLRASPSQRLALLQGLMDSDGSITRECSLVLADERLARDATELIRSLGFTPTVRTKSERGNSRPQVHIRFTTRPHMNVFRLPRKAERYEERLAEKCNNGRRHRTIRSVERVESVPVRCIQVEAADCLYLVGEGMVPTHNTAFAATHTSLKRGKVVRRATLSRVTSPTECEIEIICPIDTFRAGDVVRLSHFGQAADGLWLVGEVRRSLFQIYSTLTLVQAMQPINANSGLALGPSYLPGAEAVKPGSGTVLRAIIDAADQINTERIPYEYGGGHTQVGKPSGSPLQGFDCSGAVAAVLYAGGVWPPPNYTGSGVPTSNAIVSDLLAAGGILAPGPGSGKGEVTLFDSPAHIYMRIDGRYWQFGGPDGVPGGWFDGAVYPGYRITHILPSVLGQQATNPGG